SATFRSKCTPSVVAESRPRNAWVGLLARRCRACSAAASPSPAGGRVVDRSSVLTHSGGTAPDSHRTSLLCPSRAPKQGWRYTTSQTKRTNQDDVWTATMAFFEARDGPHVSNTAAVIRRRAAVS